MDVVLLDSFVNEVVTILFHEHPFELQSKGLCVVISGTARIETDLGSVNASLCIEASKNSWITIPPRVVANVPWLCPVGSVGTTDLSDWHRYADGELCWIRPDDWRRATHGIAKNEGVLCAVATLAHNIDTLLRYHYIGYYYGLVKWPKEWDFRPHGSYKGGK